MERWLSKMEDKYRDYAIPNLMRYIIVLYALGFIIQYVNPAIYYNYLSLDASAILHGQIWRLVTFIIDPPSSSLIWIVVSLMLYYFIGNQLEKEWGSFRFNVYYFSGVLFHGIACILAYLVTGENMIFMDTAYLNLSLFMVFAAMFPNVQFYVYFIIPVKGKWLAIIDGIYFGWTILQAFLPAYGGDPTVGIYYKAHALAAFVSMLNFILFFVSSGYVKKFDPKQAARKTQYHRKMAEARREHLYAETGTRHRCAVCGRTERDGDDLEFRYCSKCKGNMEFCQDHLFTHQHVQ